jgi:hypothetical protein
MTFTFKHETTKIHTLIESEKEIRLPSPRWGQLQTLLDGLTPINPEKVTYETSVYELKLKDGRKWTQEFTFGEDPESPDHDPLMTFDVPAPWRLSEFIHQRQMRDMIVELVVEIGLTKLRCVWQ